MEFHTSLPGVDIKPGSPQDIASVINSLSNRKVPGHDHITNLVLKHMNEIPITIKPKLEKEL